MGFAVLTYENMKIAPYFLEYDVDSEVLCCLTKYTIYTLHSL